jgi:hypothetical protein
MISDYLKAKLAVEIPAILTATSHLEGGRQVIRINGETVVVGPFASDNEVEAGIRNALDIFPPPLGDLHGMATGLMRTSPTTPLPAVNLTEPKPMANLTGSYKPGSLKALLQGVKDRTEAVMSGAVADITDLHKTLDHVEGISRDTQKTTTDIRAELHGMTNFNDDDEA